jgi:hypothetical protein
MIGRTIGATGFVVLGGRPPVRATLTIQSPITARHRARQRGQHDQRAATLGTRAGNALSQRFAEVGHQHQADDENG